MGCLTLPLGYINMFQSWFAFKYSSCFESWLVCLHWWVEVLRADRTTSMCIWTTTEPRVRLLERKIGLNTHTPLPLVIYYRPFQSDASVVVYSNCQCMSTSCFSLTYCSIWAASQHNQQNDCAPREDSDQHPPSLIKVFAVRMKKAWVLSYPLSAQRRLWSDWADA